MPRPVHASLRRLALTLDPARLAVVLAALILAFGLLGLLYRLGAPLSLFDLDGEGKPPAALSVALLASAAVLAASIADSTPEAGFRGRWRALACLFLFMAVDEMLTIHESVSEAIGVFWQIFYLPIALAAGSIWLLTLQRLPRGGRERVLMITGAVAWVVAQVLEKIQAGPSGRVEGYAVFATVEELLELSGSATFVLALLIAFRRVHVGHAG